MAFMAQERGLRFENPAFPIFERRRLSLRNGGKIQGLNAASLEQSVRPVRLVALHDPLRSVRLGATRLDNAQRHQPIIASEIPERPADIAFDKRP